MFEELKTYPSVFAVNDEYQIFVFANCEILLWIEVDGEKYYDHSNGIIRSGKLVHSVKIPMKILDKAKRYSVCYRKVIERRPYFSQTEEIKMFEFDFSPVEGENIRLYHISDTHNKVESPVKAASYKEFDLLILNGDVPEDSGKIEHFDTIYNISGEITKGHIPVVFSRGNHDLRGVCAEMLADYTPTDNGNSYYTFRLGALWGIVMDCGEDKADSNAEYGDTVCCEIFRREETKFLEKVVNDKEYLDEKIKYKLVISHVPFFQKFDKPFNIEEDTYTYWTKLLRENIKPDLMLAGHKHMNVIRHRGSEYDCYNQPCPCIIGSNPCFELHKEGIDRFIGCYVELNDRKAYVEFNDNFDKIDSVHKVMLGEEDNGDI